MTLHFNRNGNRELDAVTQQQQHRKFTDTLKPPTHTAKIREQKRKKMRTERHADGG